MTATDRPAAAPAGPPPLPVSELVPAEGPPAWTTVLIEHVSRWYGNVVAVNDVSIALGPGITGLLGPNGAGKSTLLHMAAGLLRPSVGRVTIMGQPVWRNPAIYDRIGIVPERETVYPFLTGREFVHLNATLQRLPRPDEAARIALHTVELDDAADRAIATYSKGMRQRVKVAAALVHDPLVLLLDEPFNGMDPRQRLHMMELLTTMAAAGRTIVFSSHILEEVERIAQSVLVIVGGRLAASGDFRDIRRLMTDRPHTFTIHSSDNRRLAAALLTLDPVFGVDLAGTILTVRTSDYAAFTRLLAGVARTDGITLFELRPTDESLESVFQYLVNR